MTSTARSPGLRSFANVKAQNMSGNAQFSNIQSLNSQNFSQNLETMAREVFTQAGLVAEQRSMLVSLQQSLMAGGLQDSEVSAYSQVTSMLAAMPSPQSIERLAVSLQEASETYSTTGAMWKQNMAAQTDQSLQWEEVAAVPEMAPLLPAEPIQPAGVDWDGVNLYGWGAPFERE